MKNIILLFLFLPVFCYCQNVVRIPTMIKVNEAENSSLSTGYEMFCLNIRPCYKDNYYKIELSSLDSLSNEKLISQAEVSFTLNVHKKEYKMPDGKYEWDFEATIKSNDTIKNDYFYIKDCSNENQLNCYIKVPINKKYLVILYDQYDNYNKFRIENGIVWGI